MMYLSRSRQWHPLNGDLQENTDDIFPVLLSDVLDSESERDIFKNPELRYPSQRDHEKYNLTHFPPPSMLPDLLEFREAARAQPC